MARNTVVVSISLPQELADELKQQKNASEYIRQLLIAARGMQKENSLTEERVKEIVQSMLGCGNNWVIPKQTLDEIDIDPLDAIKSLTGE